MRERHVAELLEELFRRGGLKRGLRRAEAVLLWRRLVGPELAAFSSARALQGGVLYVNVSDSETAMHLSLERQRFLDAFRERYGVTEVREIRFQVGRLVDDEEPAEAPMARHEPDPTAVAELSEAVTTLGLPQDIEREALKAGRTLLALQAARRAMGWTPCPTCGALHDGAAAPPGPRESALRAAGRRDAELESTRELCQACARYSREGRVRAAAARLRVAPLAPTPGLSSEERAVAAYLAGKALDSSLAVLLPAAVADPSLARQLLAVARLRLALAHGRPPESFSPAELLAFDPRVATVASLGGDDE